MLHNKGFKGRTVHAKHHVTHAPKNAAPLGTGASANAQSGKGYRPPWLHGTGSAPPPPSSYHRKPSAALYGDTTQMKKPAGPVNLPHRSFAGGDGHPGRKPAVHAGIPHAKKLPASEKNITVRCTWTNNVASPVHRTVSEVPSSRPHASTPYRAPTPPQCLSDSEYSTSCHDDVRGKLERMRMVFVFTARSVK